METNLRELNEDELFGEKKVIDWYIMVLNNSSYQENNWSKFYSLLIIDSISDEEK